MKTIQVNVRRYDGTKSYWQEYRVDFDDSRMVSVMNVLEEIYLRHDPTLAFFSHAACRQAACGKCAVKANQKIVLACKETVLSSTLTLEPASEKILRDLVVDTEG